MPIAYTCGCGSRIRLPDHAAGRQARCKACGAVFTVPASVEDHAPPDAGDAGTPDWLREFAQTEAKLGGGPVVQRLEPPPEVPVQPDPNPQSPAPSFIDPDDDHREDRDWIRGPERPFWHDVAAAFWFPLDADNFITMIVLTLITLLTIPVSFAGMFAFVGLAIIYGYLSAFCMMTILETASGEDTLPLVSVTNIFDDLILPMLQFVGTWIFVQIPLAVVVLLDLKYELGLSLSAYVVTAAAGIFFWPVVLLAVAIGRGFHGLWPHVIIKTVASAPLAYMAVWAALLAASALVVIPETRPFQNLVNTYLPNAALGVGLLKSVLSVYATVVAMKVIGLYYRHYKRRFPWAAE